MLEIESQKLVALVLATLKTSKIAMVRMFRIVPVPITNRKANLSEGKKKRRRDARHHAAKTAVRINSRAALQLFGLRRVEN
jgi:hypothetical protein